MAVCLPHAVTPLSRGCKSVRFGAHEVYSLKSKIIIEIIIKNWLPLPPLLGCLYDYEWLHYDFPGLLQMGLNRTRFPIIIAFCVKRSFPELSAAVLMGSLSICMLIVSSGLLGFSMEMPKSDTSLFSGSLLISDFLCQHEAIAASSALNPLNESMKNDNTHPPTKHCRANTPSTCRLRARVVARQRHR